mmetsp:Transcript_2917/g.4259  ORF Transcript_2917/g.4259 Transcript_2917/m.4259 type:complete len:449 (+) Transcript_2917:183-1529(+)
MSPRMDLQETMPCRGPDPRICYNAFKIASHLARDMTKYSKLVDPVKEAAVPSFDRDEIILGNLLGSGGFNNVFEIQQIDAVQQTLDFTAREQEKRISFAQRASGGQYAIKMLKRELTYHEEDYCNGAADLMIETKILASLEPHNNIIQLHGVSAAGAAGFAEGVEGGYFLIVDRLQDTLTQRIQTWSQKNTPLTDRILVALELSSALKHLHKYNIVFRDLKPDNVGFDANGTLKLFDFGLAKELNPRDYVEDDTYEMSGQTGSRRYMAPEVVLGNPYGLGADIYGFAVIFWQMCSLAEPFAGMSTETHFDAAIINSDRPPINTEWPKKISNIMKWSWAPDQQVRPPMKEIYRAIKRWIRAETQCTIGPEGAIISSSFDVSLEDMKPNSGGPKSLKSMKSSNSQMDISLANLLSKAKCAGPDLRIFEGNGEKLNLTDVLSSAMAITQDP